MKKLNGNSRESDVSELPLPYSYYPEEIVADGYYGGGREGDEKHLLRSIFLTLRKHWVFILGFNLLITALTIVYVAQKPNYYRARARVQVNSEINPAMGGDSKAGAVIVNNSGADPAYFATQLQILEGSGLMRRVIKTLDLENNQVFLNPRANQNLSVWQNVKRMFGFYNPSADKAENLPSPPKINTLNLKEESSSDPDREAERLAPYVGLIRNNLAVSPVKDNRTSAKETRLIEIEYTHQDPVIAAKIANAIGDVYVLQNLERKVETNASAGDFLQRRVAELQSQIRLGEERLLNYARTNQIISLEPDQNVVVQRLTSLSGQLGQAENARIAAQTAYQAAVQNEMWSASVESKDPQVAALEEKLNELRQRLIQLKTEYTDEWYEVVQTKKQIESVESQLLPLRRRATDIQLAALKEKLSEAIARENVLRNEFENQRGDVVRQNEASINYKIIQQEIETNKNLLDGMLQQSKQNQVIMSGIQNNVLVLDRAMTPGSPAGPERNRTILVAFLASLGLGLGLAFMIDWLKDSIKYTDDNENLLGLPVLAMIPLTPSSFGRKLLPSGLALTRRRRKMKRYYDLSLFEKPLFTEAYLQLCTYLMLSTAGGPPKTILVTSAEEGEGKTVTALNLAESLARTRGKVLLIDADLRGPRLHHIKDLSNTTGLTELLASDKLSDELIDQAIEKKFGENLHILTSGVRTVNPANLLSSEQMQELLKRLSTVYSHIIIDSPPVLYFADSTILSTLVDSVIIVVRDNKSSRQSILKIKKTIQNVGACITGMVINGVPAGYSGYYNYSHYEFIEEFEEENTNEVLRLK